MKAMLAILLGVTGLLMSTCGLFFTALGSGNTGIVIISIPSLAIGALLVWCAFRIWKSRAAAKLTPDETAAATTKKATPR
jgi:threonine/homoserine/homoserine lactone efflux protein